MLYVNNIAAHSDASTSGQHSRWAPIPFVCQNIPFVCRSLMPVIPSICSILPFISYSVKTPVSGQLHNSARHQSGFSLIELMVTLVILITVAGFAIPAFMRMVENNRLTSQANSFLVDLRFARSEAIKRSSWVAVCVANAAATDCDTTKAADWKTRQRLVWNDTIVNGLVDAGETILRVREPLTGNRTNFGDPNGVIYTIGFDKKGMTNLGTITAGVPIAVTLAICYDNNNDGVYDPVTGRDIVVSYTGTSKVVRPATNCVP